MKKKTENNNMLNVYSDIVKPYASLMRCDYCGAISVYKYLKLHKRLRNGTPR
jgi:hypothetical protein